VLLPTRGEHDEAFRWLELAREERDNGLTELLGSFLLSELYGDRRWPEFVKLMKYPQG
jgi:hypothetical protein